MEAGFFIMKVEEVKQIFDELEERFIGSVTNYSLEFVLFYDEFLKVKEEMLKRYGKE